MSLYGFRRKWKKILCYKLVQYLLAMLYKKGFNASAKCTDPCQPVQFMHADTVRNVSLFVNFLHAKGPF